MYLQISRRIYYIRQRIYKYVDLYIHHIHFKYYFDPNGALHIIVRNFIHWSEILLWLKIFKKMEEIAREIVSNIIILTNCISKFNLQYKIFDCV